MKILIVLLVLVAAVIIWLITGYNGFISSRNDVEESWSAMDVYLKKRYDLIPNLVNTVKGYAEHEKTTLENIVKARNSAMAAQTVEDRAKAEGELGGALRKLFALSESYPDLKAMYAPGDGNATVFRITEATATFASFTAPPRTIEL